MKAVRDPKFCPECGQPMTISKWKPCGIGKSMICPGNHLWDIYSMSHTFEFSACQLAQCACGESLPERDMRAIDKVKVCPKCFAAAEAVWQMDKDRSFARIEITPFKTQQGTYYQISTTIEIKPYPNPFMGGGMWGSASAKSEQELEDLIKGFNDTVGGTGLFRGNMKQHGLERIEIIRHDERVIAGQHTLLKVVVPAPVVEAVAGEEEETEEEPEEKEVSQLTLSL